MNRSLNLGPIVGPVLLTLTLALCVSTAAVAGTAPAKKAAAPVKKTAASTLPSCLKCHKSLQAALPKGHVPVTGKSITACLACHAPDNGDKPAPNPFAARLHRAHENKTTKLECTVCHTWKPGKSFGLPGIKGSYGAPTKDDYAALKDAVYSWSDSDYLGSLHAKNNVSCAACHGKTLPTAGDRVENEQCFKCHTSYQELAKRTVLDPKVPEFNPHGSHLGDISCNACHKVHDVSKVYCIGCHPKFQMTIPGAAK